LAGRALPCIDLPSAIPVSVSFEVDNSVDDIGIELKDGGRAFVQCKLSIHVGQADATLASVVAQWCKAVQAGEVTPDRDRVLLAVKRSTAPVRTLAQALTRAKSSLAGAPTRKEADALGILDTHATRLGFGDATSLRKVALVTSFPADIAMDAISVLGGGVLAKPEAADDAWKVLKEMARDLAKDRRGLTIREWADRLHRRGIECRADALGVPAGRAEAIRGVLHSYREGLSRRAKMMDLRGLGAALPPFEHDPKKLDPQVSEGGTTELIGWPLPRAFRRLGRILLLGLPGSGKSTALTYLAGELAKSEDPVLPIVVKMTDWWKRLDGSSPIDAVIEIASREVPACDRAIFGTELRERAAAGELALLFDGLDETREHGFAACAKLGELSSSAHPGVDIVLTTRDSAYSAGRTLPFRPVTLMPARNIEYTVGRIIATAAEHQSAELKDASGWEQRRTAWVLDVIERDERLKEVPLIPVLLAVLAGEPKRQALPENRAQVISAVIDSVLDRWEIAQRRSGRIQVGSLQSTAAVEALRESFAQVGFLLLRKADSGRQRVLAALAEWLARRWGLAPGFADSTARDLLHFWDESGMFVCSGHDPIVQPRISLIGEAGAARYLVSLDSHFRSVVLRELEAEPTVSEAISLAALLSSEICEMMIADAVSTGSVERLMIASERLLDGGKVSGSTAESLAVALSEAAKGGDRTWRAASLLVRLPVSYSAKIGCLGPLRSNMSERQYRILIASAALHSNELIADPARVLSDACEEIRVGRKSRGVIGWRATRELQDLILAMTNKVLPEIPDLAPQFAEAGSLGNMRLFQAVNKALTGIGRFDLVRESIPGSMASFAARMSERRTAWHDFLNVVANLFGKRLLTDVEARRLDSLADLIATLGYGDTPVGELDHALCTAENDLRVLAEACTLLAGLDAPAVSAEADVALAMEAESGDSELYLFCGARKRPMRNWHNIADPSLLATNLVGLLGSTQWIAQIAAEALSACPLVQPVVNGIDRLSHGWQPFNRMVAANLLMSIDPNWRGRANHWKRADDPIARRASATALGRDPVTNLARPGNLWVTCGFQRWD
jgi:hypothetical protein